MYAKIQPVSCGFPAKMADKLRVSNVIINTIGTDGSAVVRYQLYSDAGSVQESSQDLTGEAYDDWGSDDDYLLTWLAGVLGITIIEILPDPVPVPPEPEPVDPPVVTPPVVDPPAGG